MFYKLTAFAMLGCMLAPTVQAQAPTSADLDFQARCSAPGVLNCVGFDNETTDIVRGVNLNPDGRGDYRAGLDTLQKASGAGSLRFDLPPPPHSGANIAGNWSPLSNDALGQTFSQNSTFYVQFRMRMSEAMLNNTWDSSWKAVIFHMNQITCGGIELATINRYMSGILQMYTGCGTPAMTTTLDGSTHNVNPPLLMQQGDFNCQYSQESRDTCYYFPIDEWVTYYYRVHIGTWDQRNSQVELWIAREGSPDYEQVIRVMDMPLSCNAPTCGGPPGSTQGYNNLTFTPYMTGLSQNSGRSGVTANMWVDELIVSTQPIAAPSAGPRPLPPTDVTAQ